MTHPKKAIVLVNTGTPDQPTTGAVRRYLFQFLNDKRIIDIPWLLRKMLVNLIIVPFRAPRSAKKYQQLWTDEGSPLLIHLKNLTAKLQKTLPKNYRVYGTMRYGNPSLKKTLKTLRSQNKEEIIIVPLYPQYATSTTESVADVVNQIFKGTDEEPRIHFVRQFYNHPAFINAFTERIRSYKPETYDHIVFSYHGLPLRQIDKMHPGIKNHACPCTEELPVHGQYCYKATCYQTTRLLAARLALKPNDYTTVFQSRLTKNWLRPFTDEKLIALAKRGKKRILIVAPAFVADCLETIMELSVEYTALFKKHGGEKLTLVESLNSKDHWVQALAEMIKEKS